MGYSTRLSKLNEKYFQSIVSYLFVLLFVYAATSKIMDFDTFKVQLAQSPLLSAYAGLIAFLVPGIELLIAGFLLIPRFNRLGLFSSYLLMIMFTAYIYIILNFSDFIPCSCGGVLEKLSWTQHLIFNLVFILLAIAAILFARDNQVKKKLILLFGIAVLGIGVVVLLFILSEEKMQRNNAFLRRYPHHPIESKDTLDLVYNSYYFAGNDDTSIYLGNLTAPLHVMRVSGDLRNTTSFRIKLSTTGMDYKNPRLRIVDSMFFLFDGSIPIIHSGRIKDWTVHKTINPGAYFTFAEPISQKSFVMRSVSSLTGNNILGTIELDSIPKIKLHSGILKGNIDGYFDRDGQLLLNRQLSKVIYVYYYKNEWVIADNDISKIRLGKTIDTIQVPRIDIKELENAQQSQLGGKTVVVNGLSSTFGHYLFINSERLGRYEKEEVLDYASIIDCYNLDDGSYELSFYIYHDVSEKMLSFQIYGRKIYSLVGNKLYSFNIKEKHLKDL